MADQTQQRKKVLSSRQKLILYGVLLAILVVLLKLIEYKYTIRDLSMEAYIGFIALLFTVLGVWMGLKLVRRRAQPEADGIDEAMIESLGISQREHEILTLISQGHSNQEIADQLYISIATVKTHASNLYSKLDVRRRSQAIVRARELKILS